MKKIKLLTLLTFMIMISCKEDIMINQNNASFNEANIKNQQTEVLTLGSFHFKFPNLDVNKTSKKDQIDVLQPIHQKEILSIVEKLEKFEPTIIAIERKPKYQKKYDSLYTAYLNGKHKLNRSEEQQIGFRLANRMGLKQLYCTDAWGTDFEDIRKAVYENDTIAREKFINFFYNNPDTIMSPWRNEKGIFKKEGIIAELKRINSPEYNKKDLGSYLIGIFKYETEENKQFGPDYVTGWWFNRNLRIFRNIQRINTVPNDRILIIYGSGHMNLLNIFFDASPEYNLLKINDYLN